MVKVNSYILQCRRSECRFRFPYLGPDPEGQICPKCGSPAIPSIVHNYDLGVTKSTAERTAPKIEFLLDNIRSAFNVGSILRSADGAGVYHVHVCGISPTPDNPKVSKTSLGVEHSMAWTQHWNSVDLVHEKKSLAFSIWSLEGGPDSISLPESLQEMETPENILLVLGNEVTGVDPEILALSDRIVHIPMSGIKTSLNVAIACSIAIYMIRSFPIKICIDEQNTIR